MKKQVEKLQENTYKNEKETFNGTPKPTSMGCCQKEGHELGVQKFWNEFFLSSSTRHTYNFGCINV
jgi:hypothetical protein